MIVMGIDPGLATTGWAILSTETGKAIVTASGNINTKPSDGECALRSSIIVHHLIAEGLHREANLCAIEDYSYQGIRTDNARGNAMKLSFLVGAICCSLQYAVAPNISIIRKNQINCRLGLKGKVPKSRIKQLIETKFGRGAGKNEHQRDAIAVAWASLPSALWSGDGTCSPL